MFPPVSGKHQSKTSASRLKRSAGLISNETDGIGGNNCDDLKLPLTKEEKLVDGRREVYFNTR